MTYIKFNEVKDTGKTKVWEVVNSNDGSFLGVVRWHGAWRKYVLQANGHCIWSPDCLQDVAGFIEARMEDRKAQAKKESMERHPSGRNMQ